MQFLTTENYILVQHSHNKDWDFLNYELRVSCIRFGIYRLNQLTWEF